MSKIKITSLFLAITMLSGCVSVKHIPISQNQRAEILENKKSIIPVIEAQQTSKAIITKPRHAFLYLGGAVGGGISAYFQMKAGKNAVVENNILTPSEYAFPYFVEELNAKKGALSIEGEEKYEVDINSIRNKNANNLLLEIKSNFWIMRYYRSQWGKYWIQFTIVGEIINPINNQPIWKKGCTYKSSEDEPAKSYDQYFDNNAKLLKEEIQKGAQYCARQLASDFVNEVNVGLVKEPIMRGRSMH
jgi:hypothetical protein